MSKYRVTIGFDELDALRRWTTKLQSLPPKIAAGIQIEMPDGSLKRVVDLNADDLDTITAGLELPE
jgi:hypothetical protein